MKIIQLIVVEDFDVQGLGDDGELYSLKSVLRPFGGFERTWEKLTGSKTLAEEVASQVKCWTFIGTTLTNHMHAYANRIGARGKTSESIADGYKTFELVKGTSFVQLILEADNSLAISANDGSSVKLQLKDGRYV